MGEANGLKFTTHIQVQSKVIWDGVQMWARTPELPQPWHIRCHLVWLQGRHGPGWGSRSTEHPKGTAGGCSCRMRLQPARVWWSGLPEPCPRHSCTMSLLPLPRQPVPICLTPSTALHAEQHWALQRITGFLLSAPQGFLFTFTKHLRIN